MLELIINSRQREQALDITKELERAAAGQGWLDGFCYCFVPHTTAALTINEGFDPAVMHDIFQGLERMAPWHGGYTHAEGNAAAHLKAVLVGGQLTLSLQKGRLGLGQWQRVFFMEFDGPRERMLQITFSPDLKI